MSYHHHQQQPSSGGGGGGPPTSVSNSSLNYSQYAYSSFGGGGQPPMPTASSAMSASQQQQRNASGSGGGYAEPHQQHGKVGLGLSMDSASAAAGGSASASGNGGDARRRGSQRQQQQSSSSAVVEQEAKRVARVHYDALRRFLRVSLEQEAVGYRAAARDKLTRLTRSQFQELSTDVYDELSRRQDVESRVGPSSSSSSGGTLPFLPVRSDFHPKRNQARQKLATLPSNRFRDLASDVFYEIRRRHPEFEQQQQQQQYQRQPQQQQQQQSSSRSPAAATADEANAERYVPGPARRPSQMNRAPGELPHSHSHQAALSATNDVIVPNRSTIAEEKIEVPYATMREDEDEDDEEEGDDGDYDQGRDHSRDRDDLEEGSVILGSGRRDVEERAQDRDRDRQRERERERDEQDEDATENLAQTASAAHPSSSPTSSLHQRQQGSGPRYFDGRTSASSLRSHTRTLSNSSRSEAIVVNGRGSAASAAAAAAAGPGRVTELEAKIGGMERRLAGLEKELEDAGKRERWERDRAKELEDQLRTRSENAQRELGEVKAELLALQGRRKEDQAEINRWRDRCGQLEDQLQGRRNLVGPETAANIKELQAEFVVLMDEMKQLSERNEELVAEKDAEAARMREIETEAQEYRRRWERSRTELRNLKATSTMFAARPMTDDHLPASPDGNIADIHVTAFQTSIDNLLSTARSSQPSNVLTAMKAVVLAISEISDDVKAFEADPNMHVEPSTLENFKHQSTATLNSLMSAARNHAMSSGLSPISLVDAAAGHVSSNVIEIVKLLKIRKTVKPSESGASLNRRSFAEMHQRRSISAGSGEALRLREDAVAPHLSESSASGASSSHSSDLRSPPLPPPQAAATVSGRPTFGSPFASSALKQSEDRPPSRTERVASNASSAGQSDAFNLDAGMTWRSHAGNVSPGIPATADMSDPMSRAGASYQRSTAAPPTKEPSPENGTPRSSTTEKARTASSQWADLKPYLNNQCSALVNAIQQLLADIRTTGGPGGAANNNSTMSDNLSQVVAIGSSIVAVSEEVVPPGAEVQQLLKELINNTNRLSEYQSAREFSKPVRQDIASAAFGLAKSLRALMKLNA